jgi:SEC-C motif-containing protein
MKTTHPQSEWYRDNTEKWERELNRLTENNIYMGLTVGQTALSDDESVGWVTFTAKIMQKDEDISFTEKSQFEKHNGEWKYLSGDIMS